MTASFQILTYSTAEMTAGVNALIINLVVVVVAAVIVVAAVAVGAICVSH
jgi:hypothetical protein